ncbi:M20/M25/M40 family metallo-hydrolase [Klebsiella pneumoniae]
MHKKTLFSRAGRLAVAVSGALALAGAALPANASTLRIAMTAADIPLTLGQPDQGYEGNRFTGIPLYDALVEWDLSQGEKPSGLVPGLATEWHIDPQNTSRWIFTLRPGVKFHDGTEVNADAIVWNVDKVLNKAAPQYAPGQIGNTLSRMPTLTGAEKIDDHTVALTTSEPDALLPYNITNLFIVSPTAWQKQYDAVPASVRDSAARSKQAWTAFAAHAVGSGPFKLEKLVPRQQLILDKNPDYWNKDRIPRVDKVVLIPLPEANARTAALLSKQVDWIEAPAPDAIDQIKSQGFRLYANTQPHLWPWQFSFEKGSPWQDIRVRKAANLCLNRAELKWPNSRNVVPGEVTFSIDMRNLSDALVDEMDRQLRAFIAEVERESGLQVALKQVSHYPAAPFDAECQQAIADAAQRLGYPARPIVSGAGHDAVYMSYLAPTGMIFIPCKDGISHNEIEYASPEHVAAGANVLLQVMLQYARPV